VKVLLDENLPHQLRTQIKGHDLTTATYHELAGVRNGRLIAAAERDGFEVLLTGDQNMSHQQNVSDRKLAIVVLSAMNWLILRDHLDAIQVGINAAVPGSFLSIECGVFKRNSEKRPQSSP
jgi:predicted nuclease of predicted toxin-antitoxin system